MRYRAINKFDVVNGEGIACSIFFQGCSQHCPNCFNKETWDFRGGEYFSPKIQNEFTFLCMSDKVDCISLLGGEPLQQPLDELTNWLRDLKTTVNKPIYLWTSYTMKEIKKDKKKRQILKYIDVLIDGRYIDELHDFRLKLRGSSNQHIWRKNKLGFWRKKDETN